MSEAFFTVEAVAERLKVHPKTVLRFIRDGRLTALKVGRQYRVLRSHLDAFTGSVAGPAPAQAAEVTAIVDIPCADAELGRRLAALLTGARGGNAAYADNLRVDVSHDPTRDHLKVIAVGQLADTAQLLRLVQVLLEP